MPTYVLQYLVTITKNFSEETYCIYKILTPKENKETEREQRIKHTEKFYPGQILKNKRTGIYIRPVVYFNLKEQQYFGRGQEIESFIIEYEQH
jgi:hypothetical protein